MEKPTEPGFYYYRHRGARRKHIWCAQVSDTHASGLFATIFSAIPKDRRDHVKIVDLPGEWFGPLPSPESLGAR